MRRSSLLACTIGLVGCTLDIHLPEGRIACERASDCPSDWACVVEPLSERGLCYRATDASTHDADEPADADESGEIDASEPTLDAGAEPVDADETGMDATSASDAEVDIDADAAGEDGAAASDARADASLDASSEADSATDGASDAQTQPDVSVTPNHAPTITVVRTLVLRTNMSAAVTASCLASDADGDSLSFAWSASAGTFQNAGASSTQYTPTQVGEASLTCKVSDGRGGTVTGSTELRVYPAGWLALLPFNLDTADASGKGHGGTPTGGVAAEDRAGNINSAFELTGPNQDVTLAGEAAFDLDSFSFVATLKAKSLASGATIVSKSDAPFGNFTLSIYGENEAGVARRLQYAHDQTGGGPYSALLGGYTVTPGTFFQLAITLSPSRELRAYIDGVLIQTVSNVPAAQHNNAPVVLGRSVLGGFVGVIDEVQFYDRALTAAEVAALTGMQ